MSNSADVLPVQKQEAPRVFTMAPSGTRFTKHSYPTPSSRDINTQSPAEPDGDRSAAAALNPNQTAPRSALPDGGGAAAAASNQTPSSRGTNTQSPPNNDSEGGPAEPVGGRSAAASTPTSAPINSLPATHPENTNNSEAGLQKTAITSESAMPTQTTGKKDNNSEAGSHSGSTTSTVDVLSNETTTAPSTANATQTTSSTTLPSNASEAGSRSTTTVDDSNINEVTPAPTTTPSAAIPAHTAALTVTSSENGVRDEDSVVNPAPLPAVNVDESQIERQVSQRNPEMEMTTISDTGTNSQNDRYTSNLRSPNHETPEIEEKKLKSCCCFYWG